MELMVNEIEGQNSEFKENRGDEYFQWVCAFAKTDGGKLIIGLDDNGNFVDIKDSKKLSEDLPNKYSNILCIITSVNSEKTLYDICKSTLIEVC